MNNLVFATSLALLNNDRFVVHTLDYSSAFLALRRALTLLQFGTLVEVDLLQVEVQDILPRIVHNEAVDDEQLAYLSEVVVLRNMEKCSGAVQRQLSEFLDQLNDRDTNRSRLEAKPYVTIDGRTVYKPEFSCVVTIIEIEKDAGASPLLYKRLKEKFWFSQFYVAPKEANATTTPNIGTNLTYRETLQSVRAALPYIHQSHEITGYIYSLITFIRNHRLATMSQLQMRLHTDVIDKVSLLAKSIIAWKNRVQICGNAPASKFYVTPEYCKVAMRKIGYWLVEWQQKGGVFDLRAETGDAKKENIRSLLISMMSGEWYGSEWSYVKEYLLQHQSAYDMLSNTGFSNKIVEDSIAAVKPPI